MESYSVAANLVGLNGGTCWYGPYVTEDFGKYDDMEGYTAGNNLNGLNGGTATSPFWGGAYVDR
jgi:hypothetical protein